MEPPATHACLENRSEKAGTTNGKGAEKRNENGNSNNGNNANRPGCAVGGK